MREELSAKPASLRPMLDEELYTFAFVSEEELRRIDWPRGVFREGEGITAICAKAVAEKLGLRHEGEFRRISLSIESSLHAVGLTAEVSTALAARGIACNVVAAFHHDHFFVPADRAAEALEVLSSLSFSG